MFKLENVIVKHYKKLLIIPILILLLSLSIIYFKFSSQGYILERDVSLAGGSSITLITSDYNIESIESLLNENFPNVDISIRELSSFTSDKKTGIIIDATNIDSKELGDFITENIEFEEISVQEVGPGLGESFFKEMLLAILFAFIFMSIVVFIIFRKVVPSLAVIFSVILDLVGTLAIISLMDFKLSSAGIAAFLMVIGYSVDTDILLTTRVLRNKEGLLEERLSRAFKTGILMTITTVAALTIGILVSNSIIIKEMFTIIVISLIIDIVATWIMNSSLLVWYINKNEKSA